MEIMPVAKSFKGVSHGNLFRYALEQKKEETVSEMAKKIQSAVANEEANIRDSLGRQYTLSELKEKLGVVMASDTTGNVAEEGDLDSIIPY
jgi:F0F1-type ATP synthase delta subunit